MAARAKRPRSDRDDPVPAIMDALLRISRLQRTSLLHAELASRIGLDLPRTGFSILVELSEGPRRVTDLAKVFGLDQSTVSRRVDTLEQVGLVARRPAPFDGRAVMVAITDRGKAAMRKHLRADAAVQNEILLGWADERRQELATLLSEYAEALLNYVTDRSDAPSNARATAL
jgi:DNA-binding MarR family transcriptional regulator